MHNADFTHFRGKSQKNFTENDLNFIYPLEKKTAGVYNSIMKSYAPAGSAADMTILFLYTKRRLHMERKKHSEMSGTRIMLRTVLPVAGALFLFLVSAGYIAYRMISNRNYNERWKDYDECGLG